MRPVACLRAAAPERQGRRTAFVTGVEHRKGSYKGEYAEMALWFTNIFVQRDGRWQLVLHHSTPVRQKPASPAASK